MIYTSTQLINSALECRRAIVNILRDYNGRIMFDKAVKDCKSIEEVEEHLLNISERSEGIGGARIDFRAVYGLCLGIGDHDFFAIYYEDEEDILNDEERVVCDYDMDTIMDYTNLYEYLTEYLRTYEAD